MASDGRELRIRNHTLLWSHEQARPARLFYIINVVKVVCEYS
jgi:hypothetical protein